MINLLIRYGRIAFFVIPLTLLAYTPPTEDNRIHNLPIKDPIDIPRIQDNPDCLDRIKQKQLKIKTELYKLKEMIKTKR